MKVVRHFRKLASGFPGDRRGNIGIAFVAASAALMMSAGFAVNLAQLSNTRSALSNALDSAITSTARDITTGKIAAEDAGRVLEAFLKINTRDGYATQDMVSIDTLRIDTAARTIEATASVEVALAFPVFSGGATRRVSAQSGSLYSDKRIEVAMMLDITGSMAGQRIRDLKDAARSAIDAFLAGQDKTKPRVRVALVPYADAVNTGPLKNTVHVESSFTVGEPPADTDPVAASSGWSDGCATERKGSQQFTDAGPSTAMVNRDVRLSFCPASPLAPLTGDAAALKKVVDGFVAHRDAYTAGHIGIQWSWYMLSPKWADALPASARPAAYGDTGVAKFAILMTDGEFNTAFAGVPESEFTKGRQQRRSRDYAERLCAEMKAAGIEVFTVGFMLQDVGDAKKILRGCASPDRAGVRHYWDTATGAELKEAFMSIAANIERLALTR